MVDIFDVSYTVFKQAADLYTVYYFPRPDSDGYVLGAGNKDVVYTTIIRDGSNILDFVNTLLLTSELSEKEGDVLARPILNTTGNVQRRFDLTDSNFIYTATAPPGVADSDIGWTIRRITLDANGNSVDEKFTVQDGAIWNDRTISIYL